MKIKMQTEAWALAQCLQGAWLRVLTDWSPEGRARAARLQYAQHRAHLRALRRMGWWDWRKPGYPRPAR